MIKKLLFILFAFVFAACGSDDDGGDPSSLDVSKTEANFGYEADSDQVDVESTMMWTTTISPSVASDWITLNPNGGNAGKTTVTVSVKANTGGSRNAVVHFDGGGIRKSLNVKQAADPSISGGEDNGFDFSRSSIFMPVAAGSEELTLNAEEDWTMTVSPSGYASWLTIDKYSGAAGNSTIKFTVRANDKTLSRYVTLTFKSETYTREYTVGQSGVSREVYLDKDVVQLATASKGKGVNIVLMGDGYTSADLKPLTGKYETKMREAMDYFFNIQPYKAYRPYFNVYMVVGESSESGITGEDGESQVNTRFKSYYASGGVSLSCSDNYATCLEYTKLVPGVVSSETLAILVMNSTRYAGTCYMARDGFAVAMCPTTNATGGQSFEALVHHEAGGHGFGKLADEYTNTNGSIVGTSRESQLRNFQNQQGIFFNVSLTNVQASLPWKDFIGHSKYPRAGIIEGAYYYPQGVWKAEADGCMKTNIAYYGGHSRWLIASRIMKLAGETITLEQFMSSDIDDYPTAVRSMGGYDFVPTAPPVMEQ